MKPFCFMLKLFLSSFAFFFAQMLSAQVSTQWIARYNSTGASGSIATSLVVDKSGNVYVTGYSIAGSNIDYVTIKYDASGKQLWVSTYNGLANTDDRPYSITIDSTGNVYVTGMSQGKGTNYDYATVKYDANGKQLWVARYNGSWNLGDIAYSVKVDPSGNVYVTGNVQNKGTGSDYTTIKYNTDGVQQWVKAYNGPASLTDNAIALTVDLSGHVYVTGYSSDANYKYDFATIKYDTNGNQLWVNRYNSPNNGSDVPGSLTTDAAGYVYVTGSSDRGNQTGYDFTTIKYSPSGSQVWIATYNGPSNGIDNANAIAVDASGNVYISGRSDGISLTPDYATIKYNQNGQQLWVARYNGPANNNDLPSALEIDNLGNVYVTGSSVGLTSLTDYVTIKYNQNGNEVWKETYNGPANSLDAPVGLVVDKTYNVYVTGISNASSKETDFTTIKYTQSTPLKVKAYGDTTVYLGYGSHCVSLNAVAEGGTAPYKYKWSPGGSTTSKTTVCPDFTTVYKVTVTDAGGQTASANVTVTVVDVRCGNKNDKVAVCHKGKTLCIAAAAVPDHLKHGDILGNCDYDAAVTQAESKTGIQQITSEELTVSVTPNPFKGSTYIKYHLPEDGKVTIRIFDASGRTTNMLVQQQQNAGSYQKEFNAGALKEGVLYYQVTLTTGNGTYNKNGQLLLLK